MKKRSLFLVVLLAMIISLLGACQTEEAAQEEAEVEDKPVVYSSFYPIHFMTEYIGGDRIDAKTVVPKDNEVHGYELSPRKMADLEDADALFYVGLELEQWADRVVENLSGGDVPTFKVSDGLELLEYHSDHDHDDHDHDDHDHDDHDHDDHDHDDHDHDDHDHDDHDHDDHDHDDHDHDDHDHDHSHGEYDPHLWTDPIKMQEIAATIKKELIELDKEGEEEFEENYQSLISELDDLADKYESTLADRNSDHFIVSHSAFAYLADRYGLEELSVSGITPHEEPSSHRIAELIEKAEKYDLDYVFLEVLAAPEVAEVLAEEAELEVLKLDPIEGLEDEDDDYFSIMERNLENLKKELVK